MEQGWEGRQPAHGWEGWAGWASWLSRGVPSPQLPSLFVPRLGDLRQNPARLFVPEGEQVRTGAKRGRCCRQLSSLTLLPLSRGCVASHRGPRAAPGGGGGQHTNTAQSCGVRPGVRAAVHRVAFAVDSI